MCKLTDSRLFIFDMDGLMLDTETIYYQAWDKLLTADGYQLNFDFYKTVIGSPDHTLKSKYLAEFGDDFPYDHYVEQYQILSDQIFKKSGVALKYGLTDLLAALTEKGIAKAVATSSPRKKMTALLKQCGIYQDFDYSICGDELTSGKPDPEIFLRLLSSSGFPAADAVVLEDSINGILAASSANIRCIFVKDLVEPDPDILALTHASLATLKEVIALL
ncbi:hypothetical protein P22_3756 [Propionispora sp. 2/2-37]|uniref:HAD family hydrolase n=1 Tax=Propionispora sp. 2/2-37 TaxID=1677858 RepID=UPI0006BB78E9|nr:HAD family phosphatase [Propionispora sp. 2/2-37]CUH97624.1 hypothetical protein P22_3756 [Propionispora sp. 2/2-37]